MRLATHSGACEDEWLVPAMEALTAIGMKTEAVRLFVVACGLPSDITVAMITACVSTASVGPGTITSLASCFSVVYFYAPVVYPP
jgi:hypothetical protein